MAGLAKHQESVLGIIESEDSLDEMIDEFKHYDRQYEKLQKKRLALQGRKTVAKNEFDEDSDGEFVSEPSKHAFKLSKKIF